MNVLGSGLLGMESMATLLQVQTEILSSFLPLATAAIHPYGVRIPRATIGLLRTASVLLDTRAVSTSVRTYMSGALPIITTEKRYALFQNEKLTSVVHPII